MGNGKSFTLKCPTKCQNLPNTEIPKIVKKSSVKSFEKSVPGDHINMNSSNDSPEIFILSLT